MDVGGFVAFSTYMMQLTWPVIALGWVINIFQRGTASMVRIEEILSSGRRSPMNQQAAASSFEPRANRVLEARSSYLVFAFRSPDHPMTR